MLNSFWKDVIDKIDYAFQPIVNPFSGNLFAVEALIRNTDKAGFPTISEFFNSAYNERVLFLLEKELRKKLLIKFKQLDSWKTIKLFYNYEHRIMEMPGYSEGFMDKLLELNGITPNILCVELSEKNPHNFLSNYNRVFQRARNSGFQFAIDDFGVGFSNFEMLYHSEPDYIKLDRFFIENIDSDLKKRTFCEHIIRLSKLLGIKVIAEGIETEKEYHICRQFGCDLIQGYFIAKPTTNIDKIQKNYSHLYILTSKDRRKRDIKDEMIIREEMLTLPTLSITSKMKEVLEMFRQVNTENYFPVLDTNKHPIGIIHEQNLKQYIYSPFGKELLCNRSVKMSIANFITKCPIVDIKMSIEQILDIYTQSFNTEGILVTENLQYIGFLTVKSILQIINEKNLTKARDLNPLTKLPGNILINEYIAKIDERKDYYHYLIYFDFDNFKPFNDKFGFRQGDRVIQIFAELLTKNMQGKKYFIGHIGGDDFFVGVKTKDIKLENIVEKIKDVVEKFKSSVYPLYDQEDLENNCYITKNRNGEVTCFPLLDISTAVFEIPKISNKIDENKLSKILATLKHIAKKSSLKMAIAGAKF